MISSKRATAIMSEMDSDKRNALVDKLSEDDAKYLLKQLFTVMREQTTPGFPITGSKKDE